MPNTVSTPCAIKASVITWPVVWTVIGFPLLYREETLPAREARGSLFQERRDAFPKVLAVGALLLCGGLRGQRLGVAQAGRLAQQALGVHDRQRRARREPAGPLQGRGGGGAR